MFKLELWKLEKVILLTGFKKQLLNNLVKIHNFYYTQYNVQYIIVQYISATCSFIRRRERVIRSLNKVRFHRERKLTYLCIFIFFLDHCQTSGIDLNIIIIAYNIAAMGPRKKTSSSDAQHSMSIGNAKLVCVC